MSEANETSPPVQPTNSSFSKDLPNLQIAWDSTSLGALKECPRKYFYSIVCGIVPRHTSVHLTFGLLFHGALERYDHAKSAGASHEDASIAALRYAMESTWNSRLQRPWVSDDKNKNRLTLVRTVGWYLDKFKDDPIVTVQLANGKPAIELSFRFETSYVAPDGQHYLLCGHLDKIGNLDGTMFIVDRKTSKNTINASFFDKYSPDNQFSIYTLAGHVVYRLPIMGLIVDAAQVAITFSAFRRGFITRTKDQLDEWYKDFGFWLRQAEHYAEENYWPQNDKSCNNYGGCPYRGICSKSPNIRESWLETDFTTRQWDPLQIRGDI